MPNIYCVGRNTYELEPDDVVLVWPMEMHSITDADRANSLVVQFSNAFINSLFDLRRIMHLYSNLHVIRAQTHPELAQKLKEIICKMKNLFFSGRSDREIRCCMLLMEFMLTLLDYRKELAPELKVEDQYGYSDDVLKRLMSVTDYIKNNLTADDLSQAAMAEMAGISKDYFSRIFKNVTGMNYNKWLNTIRLEKASELLTEEGLNLYADSQLLARAFGNVLKNAVAYGDEGSPITILSKQEGDNAVIMFRNSGDPVPPEQLVKMFDKFYRLDQSRSTETGGFGLGLPIAKEIVELHGGTIDARSYDRIIDIIITLPMMS